ncbi:TPA: hypothetical protein ACGU7J_001604 [Vibrio vulnificus]
MSYGIYNDNGLQGFFLSEMPCEVFYAIGKATITDEVVYGFGAWNSVYRSTFLLCRVELDKLIPKQMVMRKSDPRNPSWNDEEGLLVPELSFVAGTKSGRSWGSVGGLSFSDYLNTPSQGRRYPVWEETDKKIVVYMLISSANETTWRSSSGTMSDTIYVGITGKIPISQDQQIPDFGIIMKDKNGDITFNSNYMPANPISFLAYPSCPANYKSTPAFQSSNITNISPVMFPVVNIGHGVDSNGWNANIGVSFSSDFSRYGARVNGFAGSFPYTKAYSHISNAQAALFPVYDVYDYFD